MEVFLRNNTHLIQELSQDGGVLYAVKDERRQRTVPCLLENRPLSPYVNTPFSTFSRLRWAVS